MLKIKRDILIFDDEIKERLEFIVNYTNRKASFKNGNAVSVLDTNLHYIEPYIMFIGNINFYSLTIILIFIMNH